MSLNEKIYKNTVVQYADRLYQFIFRITQNQSLANDTVKEIYQNLWNKRSKLTQSELKVFLYKTGYNLLNNDIRRTNSSFTYTTTRSYRNQNAVTKSESELLNDGYSSLHYTDKYILSLRDNESFTYNEISKVMDKDISVVKQSIFKSRFKISDFLKTSIL